MIYDIPLSIPNFCGNEEKYVLNAIREGWVSTGGKKITEFENKICEFVKVRRAVAVQSGTAGIFLALKTLGVSSGDEVIVPTLTFIAAVNPVKYCNAEPIFMDCDDSLCIDAKKVEEFCANECVFENNKLINKKTKATIKAIVAVHVFGNLCDMERLLDTAKKYNLKIVEDSTEALGTRYCNGKFNGKYAGTIGDIGVYSFNGNKIITTGGGGMIVSNDELLADRCKHLSTQAKQNTLYFVHDDIGYNFRLTNIQAALGVAQMELLERFIKIKNDNYDHYINEKIELLPFVNNAFSNKWFYSYLTNGAQERDALISHLNSIGISVRPVWSLIHEQKPYFGAQSYKIEKAIHYHDRIVNLPCSTSLKFSDIDAIAQEINAFQKRGGASDQR